MKRSRALHLLLLILCVTIPVSPQSTDATISGVVVDTSGNIITDADIEILNEATGVHYSGKTNKAGIYAVSILPPGQYLVQVSKVGFKTLIKPGIILNVQSAMALNFTLPVGATSESVTVDGGGSRINTTDASVSTVIDSKLVENIPLNGQSFQDLISMTPGVVTQSPQSSSSPGSNGDFSVNGQRTESNSYSVDGVAGNISAGTGSGTPQVANSGSVAASTALGTTQSLISVDALQEFRVQSSTYSVEYGRSPGAQFSFATRSGTNSFHGSAFDYLRNNDFDANDWFNDYYAKSAPELRQNDFGGTIGGPLLIPKLYDGHQRTFLFASYEGLRLTQPQAANLQYVPDLALRSQAPPSLQPIVNAFPIPNGIDYGSATAPSMAQFIEPYSLPAQIDSTSVRMDHAISGHVSTFFRFSDTPSSTETRSLSSVTQDRVNSQSYTFGANAQILRRSENTFRLGYSTSISSQRGYLDNFGGAVPIDFAAVLGLGGNAHPYPGWYMDFPGIGFTGLSLTNTQNRATQWNLIDTFGYATGHHNLRFGIDYRRIEAPIQGPSPYAAPLYDTAQSILSNSAYYLDIVLSLPSTPLFHETAAFVQDEWKVSSRLSLSLGVRWEVNPAPSETHGNDAYTLRGNLSVPSSLSLAPRGTPLWSTTWYNFAPRFGLAWTIRGLSDWATVLRTGGGVFYDTDNQAATLGYNALGFSANQLFFNAALPVTQAQLNIPISASPPYTNAEVYAYSPHLQLPYTLQWNVSLQQELGKQQTFTISYVGANGRRLLSSEELSYTALNPNFGSIGYFTGDVTSSYNGLQLQFQRSVARGLQAIGSFTWSHSLDMGSSYQAEPLERGNSDYDVRLNAQGGLSWELPAPNGFRGGHVMLDHWAIDLRGMARSAFPVTLYGNYATDPATGNQYYSNVDTVEGVPVYLYGSHYPGGRAIDPAAFSLPSGSDYGNAPRNFVRGFGSDEINLAARRTFPLSEQTKISFRAEGFNVLNHPSFGRIDPYLTDSTFGLATAMLNSSLGTMAPQYQQGGPRSMQFALKFLF